MKNKNCYDLFIDAILGLPFDVRTDVLNIAKKHVRNGNSIFYYLFNRVQKRDLNDPLYCLMVENGALTNEMLQA